MRDDDDAEMKALRDTSSRFWGHQTRLPTDRGEVLVASACLSGSSDGDLIVQFPGNLVTPLVRIHSECVFAEALGSSLCDCAEQLADAKTRLQEEGGLLFYLRVDGRGAGLAAKVAATALEVDGLNTYDSRVAIGVSPESRSFERVGRWLSRNGFSHVRLLTNNPLKVECLEAFVACEVEPLVVSQPTEAVQELYRTKRERFGHWL